MSTNLVTGKQESKLKIKFKHIHLLFYFFLSAFYTWPLILNLSATVFGDFGDSRGAVWWMWAKKNALLDGPVNALISAPFGRPHTAITQPIFEACLIGLSHLFGELAAYNLFAFFSFPLTAVATYFLLYKLLQNKTSAFLGGLIFGFCPAAMMQAVGGHLSNSFNAFIPILVLALFYNQSKRSILSSLYTAISFLALSFTSLYMGYFGIFLILFFIAYDYLQSTQNSESRGRIVLNYFCCGLFTLALALPFVFKNILNQLMNSQTTLIKTGQIRNFSDLTTYSSRPWEFLIPPIDHPLWGKYFESFFQSHVHGSNLYEQTIYLGIVPIVFIFLGILFVYQKQLNKLHLRYFLFFFFSSLWMYFLSLPPLIKIDKITVPGPSYFLYNIAPMFRVYSRLSIFISFSVACAAAVTLSHLFIRMKPAKYLLLVSIVLTAVILDYWRATPNFIPVEPAPQVYQWLARQPGDFIVAEYPMMSFDEAPFYTYLFWQRIHKKKLLNGATPDNEAAWMLYKNLSDLSGEHTTDLLQSIGVKFILVHKDMYADGPVPRVIKRYYSIYDSINSYNNGKIPAIPFSLKLIKNFGSDMVFSIEDPTKAAGKE